MKYCPILMAHRGTDVTAMCEEEECEWWIEPTDYSPLPVKEEGCCAIVLIAEMSKRK